VVDFDSSGIWKPKAFEDMRIDPNFIKLYRKSKQTGEIYWPQEFSNSEDKFAQADSSIADKVSDDSAQLLKLIKRIPNIKFKLTPE